MRRSAALSVLTCGCQRAPHRRSRAGPSSGYDVHAGGISRPAAPSLIGQFSCYAARVQALPRDLHAGTIGATPGRATGASWPRTSTAVMGIVATQLVDVRNVVAHSVGLTPRGSFNLGTADDFRVPDLGLHRDPTPHSYHPTAALVIESMAPRDETRAGGALAPSLTARRRAGGRGPARGSVAGVAAWWCQIR